MGKDCTSCIKTNNDLDQEAIERGNKKSISKNKKKIDSFIQNNETVGINAFSKEFPSCSDLSKKLDGEDTMKSNQNAAQGGESMAFIDSASTQKEDPNNTIDKPTGTENLANLMNTMPDQKNSALDVLQKDQIQSVHQQSKQSFDLPNIKGVGSELSGPMSGNLPTSTLNIGQQATGSQRMVEDIEEESEMMHMEGDGSKYQSTVKNQKIDDDKESLMEMQDKNADAKSDDKDQYEVEIKKQKTDPFAKIKNNELADIKNEKVFESSVGSKEDDDLDDCEMLHGSIMQDPDENSVQIMKMKKTKSSINPQRKQTVQMNMKKEFDDGSSDGSYMVRLPGQKPQVPDDMQSASSYMVKAPDNRPAQFDNSSMADSSVMMKGGASDVFEGQSVLDSEQQFMRKDSKPIDNMSVAESSEMVRDDQDNKVFDDVTSNGTFMGKGAAPIKSMDANSSEASFTLKKMKTVEEGQAARDIDADSDIQMTKD